MKLPHLLKNEHEAHFVILLLTAINTILIVIIFFVLVPQARQILPTILPISGETPIVDFNIISPEAESTVSGTVPIITTLTNGPKIIQAGLSVDDQSVQAITSQETDKLTLFWDSTIHTDGLHLVTIKITQNDGMTSSVQTMLTVQNDVSREVNQN